jgi:hypothetical protein
MIAANGEASFAIYTLAIGSHSITATYVSDTNFLGATSQAIDQEVNVASCSPAPSGSSQSMAVGTLTGQSTTGASAAVDSVAPMDDSPEKGETSMDFWWTPEYPNAGDTVTFHVEVAEGTLPASGYVGVPTGAILADVVSGGTTTVISGISLSPDEQDGYSYASFSTPPLLPGPDSVDIEYGGDSNFNSTTHGTYLAVSGTVPTTTTVAASPTDVAVGSDVSFTATVAYTGSGFLPSGDVEFKDGSKVLGDPIVQGCLPMPDGNGWYASVSCDSSDLSVGNHTITAIYSGDEDFGGSSGTCSVEVDPAGTSSVTASASPSPAIYDNPVTFTATVSVSGGNGAAPAGDVDFYDNTDDTDLGDPTLEGKTATFTTSATSGQLAVGDNTITVTYSGDSNYPSSTTTLSVTVNAADTTTTVTATPEPSAYGDSVAITATVAAKDSDNCGTPNGDVEITEENNTTGMEQNLGDFTLWGGTATVTTSELNAGTEKFTAKFCSSDGNYNSSQGSGNHTVNKAQTTTTLISDWDPSIVDESVTFTATVTPQGNATTTPTGSVQFYDGSAQLGGPVTLDANGQGEVPGEVPGTRFQGRGSRDEVPGTRFQGRGSRDEVPGTRFQGHQTRFQDEVPGTPYAIPLNYGVTV